MGAAREQLAGFPGGGLNIAYEAVDRHADGALADTVALRFLSKRTAAIGAHLRGAEARDRPVCQRARRARRAARRARVRARGRIPELYVAALGTLKHGACSVRCSPRSGRSRSSSGCGWATRRVLVTTTALYRRKVAELRWRLPGLGHVLLVGEPGGDCRDPRRRGLPRADGRGRRVLRGRRDHARGHGAAAFHQRHDRASRRGRFMSTRRWSRIARRGGRCSICARGTCSGAPPIPVG